MTATMNNVTATNIFRDTPVDVINKMIDNTRTDLAVDGDMPLLRSLLALLYDELYDRALDEAPMSLTTAIKLVAEFHQVADLLTAVVAVRGLTEDMVLTLNVTEDEETAHFAVVNADPQDLSAALRSLL